MMHFTTQGSVGQVFRHVSGGTWPSGVVINDGPVANQNFGVQQGPSMPSMHFEQPQQPAPHFGHTATAATKRGGWDLESREIVFLHQGRIEISNVIVVGDLNTVVGDHNWVVGDDNFLVGPYNVAEGRCNTLVGDDCVSYGVGAIHGQRAQTLPPKRTPTRVAGPAGAVRVSFQRVERCGVTVIGNCNTVIGSKNKVVGFRNIVQGDHNTVDGNHNIVVGDDCKGFGKQNEFFGARSGPVPQPPSASSSAESASSSVCSSVCSAASSSSSAAASSTANFRPCEIGRDIVIGGDFGGPTRGPTDHSPVLHQQFYTLLKNG